MLFQKSSSGVVLLILSLLFCSDLFTSFYEHIANVALFKTMYYVVILSLSFFYIYYRKKGYFVLKLPWIEYLLIFFLFLYLVRTVIDVCVFDKKIDFFANNYTLIAQYLFTILIPFFVVKNIKLEDIDFRKLNIILLFFYFSFLCVSLKNIVTAFQEGFSELTRVSANASFDSIAFGHTALSLLILSFSLYKISIKYKILYLLICAFALFLIFFAGSRGPVVALLTIVFIYLVVNNKLKYIIFIIPFLFLLFVYAEEISDFMFSLGSYGFERILNSFTGDVSGNVTSGRDSIYAKCIEQLQEYPLTGGGYILSWYNGGFAHNFFIESFLATGLIGGSLFCFLIIYVICKVVCVIAKKNSIDFPNREYIFYLLIQFLVYSSFSRTMVALPFYWVVLFLVLKMLYQKFYART